MQFRFSQESRQIFFALSRGPENYGVPDLDPSAGKKDLRAAVNKRLGKAEDVSKKLNQLSKIDADAETPQDFDRNHLIGTLPGILRAYAKGDALWKEMLQSKLENVPENFSERVAQEELLRELLKFYNAGDQWGPVSGVGKAYKGETFMYKRGVYQGTPVLMAYIPAYDRNPGMSLGVLDLATGKWAFRNPAVFQMKLSDLQAEYKRNEGVQKINGSQEVMKVLSDNSTLEDKFLKQKSGPATLASAKAFDASADGASWNRKGTKNYDVRARLLYEPKRVVYKSRSQNKNPY